MNSIIFEGPLPNSRYQESLSQDDRVVRPQWNRIWWSLSLFSLASTEGLGQEIRAVERLALPPTSRSTAREREREQSQTFFFLLVFILLWFFFKFIYFFSPRDKRERECAGTCESILPTLQTSATECVRMQRKKSHIFWSRILVQAPQTPVPTSLQLFIAHIITKSKQRRGVFSCAAACLWSAASPLFPESIQMREPMSGH